MRTSPTGTQDRGLPRGAAGAAGRRAQELVEPWAFLPTTRDHLERIAPAVHGNGRPLLLNASQDSHARSLGRPYTPHTHPTHSTHRSTRHTPQTTHTPHTPLHTPHTTHTHHTSHYTHHTHHSTHHTPHIPHTHTRTHHIPHTHRHLVRGVRAWPKQMAFQTHSSHF